MKQEITNIEIEICRKKFPAQVAYYHNPGAAKEFDIFSFSIDHCINGVFWPATDLLKAASVEAHVLEQLKKELAK